MRVAVAGASGFIGLHTIAALCEAGHAVVGLSRGRREQPPIAGVTWRELDVTRAGPALAAALESCDAVINLVGIKRPTGGQSFAAAHVDATAAILTAMAAAGVQRLVHVSVAPPASADPRALTPYVLTKREGELKVMSSGTAWTVVRPGPVAGPGDDFVRNLAAMIRHAAVFPAPDGGHASLQPVWVEDVAAVIVAALKQPAAIGKLYDAVGPERLTLRAIVGRVSAALELPVTLVPCPTRLLAIAVAGLEKLPDPPLTRAQLGLLSAGLVGDPGPAATELGVVTKPLTAARLAALAAEVPPWLGFSLRLRHGPSDRLNAAASAAGARELVWLVPLAVGLIAGLGLLTEHVWWRMLAANLVLAPLCLWRVPLPWRALWRPSWRALAQGVLASAALLAAGWLGSQVAFAALPAARTEVSAVYAWATLLPSWVMAPLLVVIAAGEEVVWRGAVAFAVAARLGPWWGVLASAATFAIAHVSLGLPTLVLAAAGAGLFWGWLGLKTRSLFAVLVCHVLWDACVAMLRLY